MRRAKIGLVMAGIVMVSVASAMRAADAPRSSDELAKENSELRARVAALEKQNAGLKDALAAESAMRNVDVARLRAAVEDARRRIEELEKERQPLNGVDGLQYVPAEPPVMVAPKQQEKKMPPGTVERKFNGVSVYVVPLE